MVLSLEYNTIKCLNYLIEDAARNMKLFKEKVNKQLLIFLTFFSIVKYNIYRKEYIKHTYRV